MSVQVIMPKFGMTQTEAKIVRWLHQEGEQVEQGDPLLEVETDKVVMEVESPASGVLRGVRAKEGNVVPVTQVIAFIAPPGEAWQDGQIIPTRRATPVAQRMAAEASVDINLVPASGPMGKVRRQDVANYLAQLKEQVVPVAAVRTGDGHKVRATPAARCIAREQGLDLMQVKGTGPRGRVQAADVSRLAQYARPVHRPSCRPKPTLSHFKVFVARLLRA